MVVTTLWRACRFIQKPNYKISLLTLAAFKVVSTVANAKTANKTTRSGERGYRWRSYAHQSVEQFVLQSNAYLAS